MIIWVPRCNASWVTGEVMSGLGIEHEHVVVGDQNLVEEFGVVPGGDRERQVGVGWHGEQIKPGRE
jgi:hypothetical protein